MQKVNKQSTEEQAQKVVGLFRTPINLHSFLFTQVSRLNLWP